MATDQGNKPIPGIPLGALAGISDPKVRAVLTALVDTHNVRNDLSGSGNDAFITTLQAQQIAASGGTDGATPVAQRLLARMLRGNGGGPYGVGTLSPLGATTLVLERPMSFLAIAVWSAAGVSASNTRVELHTDTGAVVMSQSEAVRGGYARSHVASSASFGLEIGSHTLSLYAGNDYGGAYTLGPWAVLIMPTS